ncbi:MAG: hypothetical protein PHD46_01475 [Eubacteriales bacterium]|nr:hypothetical protein [Eubacteriales bacterium]
MRMKKTAVILLVFILTLLTLLAACVEKGEESTAESIDSASSVGSEDSKENSSKEDSGSSSAETESLPAIDNKETEYLNVLGCTLTDKNSFVVVGQCEKEAIIEAETAGGQSVSADTDNGYYSVRLKKEGTKTRVYIKATGTLVEEYALDAKPIVPNSDMWPIVGASGYNFFFQKMMPDFMQTNTLSEKQLGTLTEKIRNRVSELDNTLFGTEIIYLIVPSKASIYPELVPEDYAKGTGESKLEQVNNALEAGGATVIDLLDVFSEHKDDEYKLYWKTDSHWTDYGAYIAYNALFDYISGEFPGAAPRPVEDFDFAEDYYNGGDMIFYMMMDQDKVKEFNYYRTPAFDMNSEIAEVKRYRAPNYLMYDEGGMVPERQFSTGNKALPDFLLMRDSYSTQIYDILADRGNNTLYKSMWNYAFNISEITEVAPDYIIYILAEWNIDSILQS